MRGPRASLQWGSCMGGHPMYMRPKIPDPAAASQSGRAQSDRAPLPRSSVLFRYFKLECWWMCRREIRGVGHPGRRRPHSWGWAAGGPRSTPASVCGGGDPSRAPPFSAAFWATANLRKHTHSRITPCIAGGGHPTPPVDAVLPQHCCLRLGSAPAQQPSHNSGAAQPAAPEGQAGARAEHSALKFLRTLCQLAL